MRISVVVGNPKPGSRTLEVAERVAGLLADPADDVTTTDLATCAGDLFTWPSTAMTALVQHVAGSDLVVMASPTYKATYTGLLKSFLDRFASSGLADVPVVPVMTAGDRAHAMAAEVHLRPLLVELGAVVPARALFVEVTSQGWSEEVVAAWAGTNRHRVRQTIGRLAGR